MLKASPPYSLRKTLSCGQAFRWRWDGEAASGVFAGRSVRLVQGTGRIRVQGLADARDLEALGRYLGINEPLAEIEEALRSDRIIRRILPHTSGIALMRQDPWECMISFIVSAFNNIPKIELTLDRLSRRFGTRQEGGWMFPSAVRLASATRRELRLCLLGYRAPYVAAVARQIARRDVDLAALAELSYDDARRRLLALPGVGDKVADCLLLFAYGKGEAFPVDIWVKRAVERWYFGGQRKTERQIRTFARDRFGALAGYAQQHLYYYIRERGTGNGERRKTPDANALSRSGRLRGR
ncbi:MAG: hypothetical protein HYY39_01065 [Armatimonadetes bacterium]|nr:hypothetical protein [Armatimonadota bacterium]MBI2972365.1 hypothetical protein [Armatimonadota bacterium]